MPKVENTKKAKAILISETSDVPPVTYLQTLAPNMLGNETEKVSILCDFGLQQSYTAVSYTHLDVYKRQIQGCMRNII